jgi:hypothetical protein
MGLPAIIGDRPYSLTAVAHAHAEVSFVTRDVFSRLMLSEPTLAIMILKVLAAEVTAPAQPSTDAPHHRNVIPKSPRFGARDPQLPLLLLFDPSRSTLCLAWSRGRTAKHPPHTQNWI